MSKDAIVNLDSINSAVIEQIDENLGAMQEGKVSHGQTVNSLANSLTGDFPGHLTKAEAAEVTLGAVNLKTKGKRMSDREHKEIFVKNVERLIG